MSTAAELQLPGAHERALLRDELRAFLQVKWPPVGAVQRQRDKASLAVLWQGLSDLGLTTLGSQAEEGGVRELVVVMEELGRAAAPAPVLGSALANQLADLEKQGDHGVNYIRYWVDEEAGKIFCLVDAPDAETAAKVHREAHGLEADEIFEVTQGA